jgi:hypothetical protein
VLKLPLLLKEGCHDKVGRGRPVGVVFGREMLEKYAKLERTTPSKFDFVRILSPLLEKEGNLKT